MIKYLHIANPDKFTIRLSNFIIKDKGLINHSFLFISNKTENKTEEISNISYFKSPIRKHLWRNILTFQKLCSTNDLVISHGAQATYFFLLFPWFMKKMAWVINGADLYCYLDKNMKHPFFDLKKCVLKKSKIHLTHIEGDSELANKVLGGNASHYYTPMYLSNVVTTHDFFQKGIIGKVKIMVGNSNSTNNNHIDIFSKIKKYDSDIEKIVCPLSYGNNIEYKDNVIRKGRELFGDKFEAIENFMPLFEYKKVLQEMDVVVFDHWRQEAMGVTLTLMSLGKIVYVNPYTTSFQSLSKRGFRIFDNNLLFNEGPRVNRNVQANKELLNKYYSEDILLDSLLNLSLV